LSRRFRKVQPLRSQEVSVLLEQVSLPPVHSHIPHHVLHSTHIISCNIRVVIADRLGIVYKGGFVVTSKLMRLSKFRNHPLLYPVAWFATLISPFRMQTRLRKRKDERLVEKYVEKRGLTAGSSLLESGGHFRPVTGVPGLFSVDDIAREFGDLLRSVTCYFRASGMVIALGTSRPNLQPVFCPW
jgi:hypothetical protein